MTADRRHRRSSFVTLALGVAVAAIFSALCARRAWVNDDAFITYRYARHLAAGHGFVWNTTDAQRVEGSSSLAWTGLNAIVLRAGGDPLVFSHWAGWAAGLLTLALVVFGARAVLGVGTVWSLVGGACLALQPQWVTWSVSGMETSAGACVTLAATLLLLRETRTPHRRGYASGAVFLIATLFRPETPLLHVAATVGILLGTSGARPWRALVQSGLVHTAGLLALTVWRVMYFGQPLPNTFYAKAGSPQLTHGFEYLVQFVTQNSTWLWVVPLGFALPRAWRHARATTAAFVLQIVGWSAWVVVLGGGRWEFRFFVAVLPACAVLLGHSLALWAASTHRRLQRRAPLFAAAVAAAVLATQGLALRTAFRPFNDVLAKQQLLESVEYMRLEAALLARYVSVQERVCTGWAGAFPYFTGVWHYDPWGLNEPSIAHRPRNDAAVVFHQRHADWGDLVDNHVQFVDAFNHFLFPRPFDVRRARNVTPWTQPGVAVYSVRLPEGHYWLFASTWMRQDVEAWLAKRGLQLESVAALPAGWPILGE